MLAEAIMKNLNFMVGPVNGQYANAFFSDNNNEIGNQVAAGPQVVPGPQVALANPILPPNHPTNLDRTFIGPPSFKGPGGAELSNPDLPPDYQFVVLPNGDYLIKDPDGIARRGFAPMNSGLTNQSYARNLAAAMLDQYNRGLPRVPRDMVHFSEDDLRFIREGVRGNIREFRPPNNSQAQRRAIRDL